MKTFFDYVLPLTSTNLFHSFMTVFTFCYYVAIYYAARQIKNIQLAYFYLAYIFFLFFILGPLIDCSIDFYFDNYYFPLKDNPTYTTNNFATTTLNDELNHINSTDIENEQLEKPQKNLLKWLAFWYIIAWVWAQI